MLPILSSDESLVEIAGNVAYVTGIAARTLKALKDKAPDTFWNKNYFRMPQALFCNTFPISSMRLSKPRINRYS